MEVKMHRGIATYFFLSFIFANLLITFSCKEDSSPTKPQNDQQNLPPIAQFTANPASGNAPLVVSFNASASSDQDGQIVSYTWNFGDNSSAGHGVTTQHTYQKEGNYTATLVVTDDDSSENSKSMQITVTAPPGPTLFPMYKGAQWAYDVSVYNKLLTENSGSTEYGKITLTVTEYDSSNIQAELSVEGDLNYFVDNYVPITIPEKVYIREKSKTLERAVSSSGPWETTMKLSGVTWNNGGLILAGSNYRTFSAKESQVTTPAGVFSGYLVGAEEDNWAEQYKTDDHEYSWKELFNLNIGLIWSKYYLYYDDKGDQYGPAIISKEISLTGYAVPLPDGTLLQGGSGASIQVIVDCTPGARYPADSPPVVTDKNAQIHLWFSMDVDATSVEQAFGVGTGLNPNSPPLFYATAGSVNWEGNRHFIWTPNQPFSVDPVRNTYVFAKLETTAHSISGTFLSKQLCFIFQLK
jgi:PKD repeat protein